ncbi:MAG: VWA domain-containing protein [Candidatus Nanopelagicales bacterium]
MTAAWTGWPMVDLAAIAAAFGQRLHAAGVPVTPERSARFAEAVALVGPTTLRQLYWTGRISLLSGPHQQPEYDRVFAEVFRGIIDMPQLVSELTPPPPPDARLSGPEEPGQARNDPSSSHALGAAAADASGEQDQDAVESALAAVSTDERLAARDFSECTPEELAAITALVARLPMVPPRRVARRRRRHRSGRHLDVRATLRAAYRTGGDPVRPVRRQRTDRPRRVVLIADVSGSMEPYSRVYLHLMRGAVRALHAETFVFATRLTRLTRVLAHGSPDAAYHAVARAAPDWSGGTRIGQALTAFLDEHGRRGVARGAVVVIVSDGWEIDDPATLGAAMDRLARLAYHIIWVNPRSARTGFEPLTGGMSVALPYVDTFVSGHSVRALDEVLAAISSASRRAPARGSILT